MNSTSAIEDNLYNEIIGIVNGSSITSSCDKCIASAELLHILAITQPVSTVVNLLIRACNAIPAFESTIYAATCYEEFSGIGGLGPYWAQLFSKMSIATGDMQAFCHFNYDVCDQPPTIEINESQYFSPKPASANVVPEPCGETIEVLHISDWHLDPRYDIGSEANCSQYLCCRPYATNTDLDTTAANASIPASRFGSLYCDAPPDLALSSFNSMSTFFDMENIGFAIFTGDIVSHDNDDQLSRAYIEYEETVTYEVFKAEMGNIPVRLLSIEFASNRLMGFIRSMLRWATMILCQKRIIRKTRLIPPVPSLLMLCPGTTSSFRQCGRTIRGLQQQRLSTQKRTMAPTLTPPPRDFGSSRSIPTSGM